MAREKALASRKSRSVLKGYVIMAFRVVIVMIIYPALVWTASLHCCCDTACIAELSSSGIVTVSMCSVQATDPLDKYCDDNPEADECRVYED